MGDAPSAAEYYNKGSVVDFYSTYWGGSDIHIGLYATGRETIAEASEAMTRYLLDRARVASDQRVLDIACGYGGTLRLLARLGCKASGFDISTACVRRARELNAQAGFADAIDVRVGDFHRIDSEDAIWDRVVCQESIIHADRHQDVFAEVYRVLRPGGLFAVSDIFAAEDGDADVVQAAYARLGVTSAKTISDYVAMAQAAGFEIEFVEERAADIRSHYNKLAGLLENDADKLGDNLRSVRDNIAVWQKALAAGAITWGCLVAQKPSGGSDR